MKSKREKRRATAVQRDKALSDEDNDLLQKVYETQENADSLEADEALLSALRDVEKVKGGGGGGLFTHF